MGNKGSNRTSSANEEWARLIASAMVPYRPRRRPQTVQERARTARQRAGFAAKHGGADRG